MLKKIYDYLSTHGMMLMIIGFAILAGCLMVSVRVHNSKVTTGVIIAALVVYITGRIFVATNRHRSRKKDRKLISSEDES
jgi:membrane-bound ClpP family serine protease